LAIQTFGPGEVDERPQFGIFFLCLTESSVATVPHRWIRDPGDLEGMDLFHPLVGDLARRALDNDSLRDPLEGRL
jgi:hypothetical protein